MSDESSSSQGSRLKFNSVQTSLWKECRLLRPSLLPLVRQGSAPPARPAAPGVPIPPAVPGATAAADPTLAAPPPIRLKPRISIKSSEPERAGETVEAPGLPPVVPPIRSGLPAAPGEATERVKIDIGFLGKPLEAGLPAAVIPSAKPTGAEKPEAAFKIKLKPAPVVNLPGLSAPAGFPEGKSAETAATPSTKAGPALAEVLGDKGAPTPRALEVAGSPKPGRRALLMLGAGLLVLLGAGYFWFFVRGPAHAHAAAAVANPPLVAPRPAPPVVVAASPMAATAVLAAGSGHPAEVGVSPAGTTTGSPTAATPSALPAVVAPVPTAPAAANPPPAPALVPSEQFRTFVDHLKIGGVRSGPPPRLFVDGVSYRPGEALDRGLGVVFVGVDANTNEIIFKDTTGAEARRRF